MIKKKNLYHGAYSNLLLGRESNVNLGDNCHKNDQTNEGAWNPRNLLRLPGSAKHISTTGYSKGKHGKLRWKRLLTKNLNLKNFIRYIIILSVISIFCSLNFNFMHSSWLKWLKDESCYIRNKGINRFSFLIKIGVKFWAKILGFFDFFIFFFIILKILVKK